MMVGLLIVIVFMGLGCRAAETINPSSARIEGFLLSLDQGHSRNPAVIWYDDFDEDRLTAYLEPVKESPHARYSARERLGAMGRSMECFYPKGSRGFGNRKLVFGDSPIGKPVHRGRRFEQIYWRIYLKHEPGWVGAPDKLSRATGIVSPKWNQAFILHVWSSGLPLTLDPATGVREGFVQTERYNDFPHLKWLGNSPRGLFPLHDSSEANRWVCVEAMIKLNGRGESDGQAQLWVDGRLDSERKNLNWRDTYDGVGAGVNAVFLEAYWNEGSPQDQYRWIDDFVVSTEPIGPATADNPVTLIRRPGPCSSWQVEISADGNSEDGAWTSQEVPGSELRLTLEGVPLRSGEVYFCRIRTRQGEAGWSQWSSWHQPFRAQ